MFTGILHLYTECYAINSYRDPVALFPNSNKSENLFQLIFLNYRLIPTLSNWFFLTITSTYLLCLITINIQFYSFTARFYLFWIMTTDGNIRIDLTKWKMFEIHWLTTTLKWWTVFWKLRRWENIELNDIVCVQFRFETQQLFVFSHGWFGR